MTLSPLGTPLIHLEMWSPRWTLPSPTSWRMRSSVKALAWLAILNCMLVVSRLPVLRSATPHALTKVPFGLQMPIRTPGARFVSLNRRTACRTLASVCGGRGPLAPGRAARETALAPLDPNAAAPTNRTTRAKAQIDRTNHL